MEAFFVPVRVKCGKKFCLNCSWADKNGGSMCDLFKKNRKWVRRSKDRPDVPLDSKDLRLDECLVAQKWPLPTSEGLMWMKRKAAAKKSKIKCATCGACPPGPWLNKEGSTFWMLGRTKG